MLHRLCQMVAFLLVVALFFVPALVVGQARTEGQLSGKVVDPSGAVVPEANLTLSQSCDWSSSVTATTNASGVYVFPSVAPGTYKLTVDAKGFARGIYDGVAVYTGRTTDMDLKLVRSARHPRAWKSRRPGRSSGDKHEYPGHDSGC